MHVESSLEGDGNPSIELVGIKLLRMQSVGESVEECPASAYCYNMTASAALVVDVVKAGCSTWRCMDWFAGISRSVMWVDVLTNKLARDKCISTTFQFIPVSLCCCSHDRCNVGGHPAYDSITSGGGESGGWGGGGSSDGGNSGGWGGGGRPTTPPSTGRWSPDQIKDKFKDYDVDHRDDNNNGEEEFKRVDWRETPAPATRGDRNRGKEPLGGEIELRG
ncbi:hypothetical protein TELCIR_01763 [Teladorsagia circumcincta]|uniref:Uncharacterized protein n=1 Tax=Teladorsagia circumcincta TaxID=45464 RepID=A0A2G9V101_TELCI|nr:hypothetical protein TELCIR_01763 [Teladorsagia circumcincta]